MAEDLKLDPRLSHDSLTPHQIIRSCRDLLLEIVPEGVESALWKYSLEVHSESTGIMKACRQSCRSGWFMDRLLIEGISRLFHSFNRGKFLSAHDQCKCDCPLDSGVLL